MKAEGDAVTRAFADLMRAAVAPDDPPTAPHVAAHRAHVERWFYPCSGAMQRGIAAMYVADERFAANYDRIAPGLAVYLRDAILAHAPDA